jgi:hypothetical protein
MAAEMVRNDLHALALVASTIGLSAALAAIATRAKTVTGAALWLLLAPPLGVVNTVVSLAAVGLINGQGGSGLALAFWFGGIYGFAFGAPLGIALGLAYAVPILAAARARVRPSHDGPDRVLAVAGAFAIAAGALGVAIETQLPAEVYDGKSTAIFMGPLLAMTGGLLGLGAGVARLVRRRRWIRAVAAERIPGFCIVPRDPSVPVVVPPLFRADPAACDLVVLRVEGRAEPGIPYRSGAARAPFALLRMPRCARW